MVMTRMNNLPTCKNAFTSSTKCSEYSPTVLASQSECPFARPVNLFRIPDPTQPSTRNSTLLLDGFSFLYKHKPDKKNVQDSVHADVMKMKTAV